MKWQALILFFSTIAFSQTRTVSIDFRPMIDGTPYSESTPSPSVSVCKFYVSNLVFLANGKPVYELADSYFLIDFSSESSWYRNVEIPETCRFDQFGFTLGIDAQTNEKGIGEGDLDPSRGMYWAWQSGYINLKLEGIRNGKSFELHLGGFQDPFLACQSVILPAGTDSIAVFVDPWRFLQNVPEENLRVMSPGEKAVALSKLAINMFYR